jgi:pectin methylesterase-like acyl-CoA thioesterase
VRNTALPAGIIVSAPYSAIDPSFPWQNARFSEYANSGAGAGVNANRPQLTDAQAAQYTAQAYLAGSDGWNPVS